MALSAPTGFASTDLVYNDDFSGTTLDNTWHTYTTSNAANGYPWNDNGSGGSGVGASNYADYDMPSQVSVSNGQLDLTASKKSVSGMDNGTAQTFPYTGGAVSGYGNFEFKGGYLQISMKQPSGDGTWPALWLLPGKGAGSSGDNFEIDMQEGGFTESSGPTDDNFTWHLHSPAGWVGASIDSGVDLTAGFHTYGINWVPGQSITWYLDGKQMAQVTSAQATIPNEPMQLIMNNGVANSNTTGWHTVADSSTPASTQMLVDQVQLYQKAGGGNTVTGANVTASTASTAPATSTPATSTPATSTPATSTPATSTPTTPTVKPAVTQATASPATGKENVGDTITLTLGFNKAVTVTGTPKLSLNDGDSATYVSGSGTNALTFRTTVASTDTSTSALAITGVSLPSGASIKDASGAAANLTAAVKTFSGLQVDPPSPTTSSPTTSSPTTSTPTTPTTPVLTIADTSLSVNGRGGAVNLGTKVAETDSKDAVTLNVKGLPSYETITDKRDGHTFKGNNITLTAAQVNSGLTLHSYYRGSGDPVATLTLKATAKDPDTGAVKTSAPQTITVKDPPPATGASAALASQSFALLNQHLAGGGHQGGPGQFLGAVPHGTTWNPASFLTRPHH